mmetsp:Transcript_44807/g.65779  ORF Transcript_44807/g.65779 Transcript_44807/m.65779 type:complete len:92 (+) Transcript_44807:130-405(+)
MCVHVYARLWVDLHRGMYVSVLYSLCIRLCGLWCFSSLWNAAHDDTIPDPEVKKTRTTGLHNTGWLWTVGDKTTGASVRDITGQDTHVPFH